MKNIKEKNFLGLIPKRPEQMLIMLHGYGTDAANLLPLADDYLPSFPNLACFSLHAPFDCEAGFGRQWFSLSGYTPARFLDMSGNIALNIMAQFENEIAETFSYVKEQILAISEICGLDYKQTVMLGFSQGASVSLAYSLCSGERVLGAMSFSGLSTFEANQIKTKVPVFLAHGSADSVVPFSSLVRSSTLLDSSGVPLTVCPVEGLGHTINGEEISASIEFMKNLFTPKKEGQNEQV